MATRQRRSIQQRALRRHSANRIFRITILCVLAFGLVGLIASSPVNAQAPGVLLNKRYDQQTFLMTHNSYANPGYHYGLDLAEVKAELRFQISEFVDSKIRGKLGDLDDIVGDIINFVTGGRVNAKRALEDAISYAVYESTRVMVLDALSSLYNAFGSSRFAPLADNDLSLYEQLDAGARCLTLEVFRMRQLPSSAFYQVSGPDVGGFLKTLHLSWPDAIGKIKSIAVDIVHGNKPSTSDLPTFSYDIKPLTKQWDLKGRTQVDYKDPNSQYSTGPFSIPDKGLEKAVVDLYVAHDPTRWGYMLTNLIFGQYPYVSLKQALSDIKLWMTNHPKDVVTVYLKMFGPKSNPIVGQPTDVLLTNALQGAGLTNMIFYADQHPGDNSPDAPKLVPYTLGASQPFHFHVPNYKFAGNAGIAGPDGTPWANWKHGWPTLQAMVNANKRLVLFTDKPVKGFALTESEFTPTPEGGDCFDPQKAILYKDEDSGQLLSYPYFQLSYPLFRFAWYPEFSTTGPGYLTNLFAGAPTYDRSLGIVDYNVMNSSYKMGDMLWHNILPSASRYPNFVEVKFQEYGLVDGDSIPVEGSSGGLIQRAYFDYTPGSSGPLQVLNYFNKRWNEMGEAVSSASVSPAPNSQGWIRQAPTVTLSANYWSNPFPNMVWVYARVIDANGGRPGIVPIAGNYNHAPNPKDLGKYSVKAGAPVTDGVYVYNYYSTGAYVNRSSSDATVSFRASSGLKSLVVKLDSAPPTVVSNVPTGRTPKKSPWVCQFPLTVDGIDGLSGIKRLDITENGKLTSIAGPLLQPITNGGRYSKLYQTDGIYDFTAAAVDNADNQSAPLPFKLFIDRTPPATTASISDVQVKLTAKDNLSGIDQTFYQVDGGQNWLAYSGPFAVSRGSHTVYFYSVDMAGNEENHSSATVVTNGQDVTGSLQIVRGGFTAIPGTDTFIQQITLRNTSSSPVKANVSVVLDQLTAGVTLINRTGETSLTSPPGSPYIDASTMDIQPGTAINTLLRFSNPSRTSISYTVRIIAGPGAR